MVSTLPGWTHVYPATHTPELMHWASHPRRPRPSLLRTPPEEWCISSHLLSLLQGKEGLKSETR